MRTTLTLDPDVAALLTEARDQEGRGLKELINDALRKGLRLRSRKSAPALQIEDSPTKPYRIRPVRLGRCLIDDLDNVAEALAQADDESFR